MIKTFLAIGLMWISPILFPDGEHAYYVGLTDIAYNAETTTLEIAVKVFTDDLELAIQGHSGVLCHLGTQKEVANADSLINAYVRVHLSVNTDQQPQLKCHPIGRETELDVTWLYIESEPTKPFTRLLVSNDMFMELYDAQVHVVKYKKGDDQGSTLLRKGKTSDALGI
jgi:hypothetical protein